LEFTGLFGVQATMGAMAAALILTALLATRSTLGRREAGST